MRFMKKLLPFFVLFGACCYALWSSDSTLVVRPICRNPFIARTDTVRNHDFLVTACMHDSNTVIKFHKHQDRIRREILN